MVAPESLLRELARHDPAISTLIDSTGPLVTPYAMLVQTDGWLVDPNSAEQTAPFDDPALRPEQRAINTLLVACDYAVRRGASSVAEVMRILARESPIGILAAEADTALPRQLSRELGIAVPTGDERPASFSRRARAQAELRVPCDPVLSFQPRALDWDMGDNSHSSFLVHNLGEVDGLTITGDVSERWGVDVGLPRATPLDALAEIEREVAVMPSFLRGVTSEFNGQTLEVGWRAGEAPAIEDIGQAIWVWTKSLYDLEFADVRIVFAPADGRAPVLTEMRKRALAFRLQRDAALSGRPDPDPPTPDRAMSD